MRIWLITVGEPLPTDGNDRRLLRTGMLAEQLVRHGHTVTWWTSAFDHTHKTYRSPQDSWQQVGPSFRIRLLRSCGYRANVSLRRLLDHRNLAIKFASEARRETIPDLILCSLPTLELCEQAVAFGRYVARPIVIDVRDLWPNVFLDLAPSLLRPLMNAALWPLWEMAGRACAGATAIIGLTDRYVEWGVRLAGRRRRPHDRVFPMAYTASQPAPEEIAAAREYWQRLGIGTEPDQLVGCFFGSVSRHSEIPTIIDAARILAAQGRNVKFAICGVGEKLDTYRRYGADCPQVLFPGWVDAAKIWTLMRISHVGLCPFVSSSNYVNNIPNKPIEYLSAGLPVLSSLQGVLADMLQQHECGLTYANRNVRGLAEAVASLMDRPDALRRMAENARRLYQQQFVAQTVYRQMAEYLVDLAGGRNAAAA